MDGTIYLLHFDRPVYHARHYLGWALDVDRRVAQHAAGSTHASPLVRALLRAGGAFVVARTWHGDRYSERALKRRKNTPEFCPICNPATAHRRALLQTDSRVTVGRTVGHPIGGSNDLHDRFGIPEGRR